MVTGTGKAGSMGKVKQDKHRQSPQQKRWALPRDQRDYICLEAAEEISQHRERWSPCVGAATTEAHSTVESQYVF